MTAGAGARDEILARVRAATTDVTTEMGTRRPEPVRAMEAVGRDETLELFAENVADYRATVIRVDGADGGTGVGAAISRVLREHGCTSVVVPAGLDPDWRQAVEAALAVHDESDATSSSVLDRIDAVVTGSAVGIATTGTIVLDHGADQGRRELTLVPDTHVCVIRADQIVHDVPEAVSRLRTESGQQRVLTWISGPSATSDIELQRVEGVHGPRTLIVVLVSDGPVPDELRLEG